MGGPWAGGGVLERLGHRVGANQARDHDGRGHAEALVGQVDVINGLGALQLVDLERVAVDTAQAAARRYVEVLVSAAADTC